jgi:hypothetical protein
MQAKSFCLHFKGILGKMMDRVTGQLENKNAKFFKE